MRRMIRDLQGGWQDSQTGQALHMHSDEFDRRFLDLPPTCSFWTVALEPYGRASIEATEESPGLTQIVFLDGYWPFPGVVEPIGVAFKNLARVIAAELERGKESAGGQALSVEQQLCPTLRPSTRESYAHIIRAWQNNPSPSLSKVAQSCNVSKSTVGRARRAWRDRSDPF